MIKVLSGGWGAGVYSQRDDVRWESVRHGSDILTQGIIFGAGAPDGASGLPHPPPVRRNQADSGDPHQERPSLPPSPSSSHCSARVSHSFCPGRVLSILHHATSRQKEKREKKKEKRKNPTQLILFQENLSLSFFLSLSLSLSVCFSSLVCFLMTGAGAAALGCRLVSMRPASQWERHQSSGFVLQGRQDYKCGDRQTGHENREQIFVVVVVVSFWSWKAII